MKSLKILFFCAIFTFASQISFADTIHFKNGTRIDVGETWEEGDQVKCKMYGTVVSYPKSDIDKVVKIKQKAAAKDDGRSNIFDASLNRFGIDIIEPYAHNEGIKNVDVDGSGGKVKITGISDTKKDLESFIGYLNKYNKKYKFKLIHDEYMGVGERKFEIHAGRTEQDRSFNMMIDFRQTVEKSFSVSVIEYVNTEGLIGKIIFKRNDEYFGTGDKANKVFAIESARLFRKVPRMERLKMTIKLYDKEYLLDITRTAIDRYYKTDFSSMGDDLDKWRNNFIQKYDSKRQRSRFVKRFVKQIS